MLNTLQYQGRLVRDPVIKTVGQDHRVLNISIAWSRKIKDRENKCYLDVTFWDKTADRVNSDFRKGDPIIIEGHLQTESWQDKETGKNRSKIICVASAFHYVKSKSQTSQAPASADGYPPEADADEYPSDEDAPE
jgi:single-strand DNA-binding protein